LAEVAGLAVALSVYLRHNRPVRPVFVGRQASGSVLMERLILPLLSASMLAGCRPTDHAAAGNARHVTLA
jgi:hypothetical protein